MPLPASQSFPASDDVNAIRGLLDRMAAAWNRGDGGAYGECFTEDCDYVTFNGERQHGRDAVTRSHQELFETHLAGSRLIFEDIKMQPVQDGLVLIHSVGNSMLKGQKSPSRSRRSMQTLLALRTPDGWRFRAFHNTRIFKITPFRAILMAFGL